MDLEDYYADWVRVNGREYCGHNRPADIHLYGRQRLVFHSDISRTFSGFEVHIERTSPPTTNAPTTAISPTHR